MAPHRSQPWLPSRPGLAASYENVAQLVDLLLLHQCRAHHSTDDPNTWPSSRPSLAAHGRDYGLPLVRSPTQHWFSSQATTPARAPWSPPRHDLWPFIRPVFTDSGRINCHVSLFLRSLFPPLLEYFGVRRSAWQSATRPSLRDPLLARLLLVLLSLYLPSRVCALIRYGWYCGWWRCSKVPVRCSFFGSLLDSPFFVLWQFPCWTPSLLAAAVSPCAAPFFNFLGLAVLADASTAFAIVSLRLFSFGHNWHYSPPVGSLANS